MTLEIRPTAGPSREYHFPKFTRHVMPNGLKIIVAPTRKLPVVTLLAVVDAGAITDLSGFEGLAQITAKALRRRTESKFWKASSDSDHHSKPVPTGTAQLSALRFSRSIWQKAFR